MNWREKFERLSSDGEHYKCKKCGSVFSDVKEMPEPVKRIFFEEHIKECHSEN